MGSAFTIAAMSILNPESEALDHEPKTLSEWQVPRRLQLSMFQTLNLEP